jgi:hypothetical protein
MRRNGSGRMLRDLHAIKITRTRKFLFKDPPNAARRCRHDHYAVCQAGSFANIVSDEKV